MRKKGRKKGWRIHSECPLLANTFRGVARDFLRLLATTTMKRNNERKTDMLIRSRPWTASAEFGLYGARRRAIAQIGRNIDLG